MEADLAKHDSPDGLSQLVDKALAAAQAYQDAKKEQEALSKQLDELNAKLKRAMTDADTAVAKVWGYAKYPDVVEVHGVCYVRKAVGCSWYQLLSPVTVYKEEGDGRVSAEVSVDGKGV